MKKLLSVVTTIGILVLSGCTSSKAPAGSTQTTDPAGKAPAAQGEILIGNIQDLSGPTAAWGKGQTNGSQLAVDKINAAGGVGGRQLKLISYDTKGDVTEAINAYNRLVEQDKVVAVLGPPTSNIGIALAPLTDQKKVPILGDFIDERATTPQPGKAAKYMFLGEPSAAQQAELMADYALKKLGLKKFAMLYDQSNAFAVSMAGPFEKYVKANGGEVVASQTFQKGDKEYRAQLSRIKEANPDALYIPNYAQENALAAQQARELGIKATLLGNNALFTPFVTLAGAAAEGAYFPNNVTLDDPALQEVLKEYNDRFKVEPVIHIFFGYDNVLVVADAIKRAGGADPEAITAALASTRAVEGYTGEITLSPETHRPVGLPMVMMTVKDGQYKAVESYVIK
ncbi:MAG TPA: ABC transporter substrate-binding protein [Symbiobacteriaceae bacterium]|nr:ABC transporter substrate-binding protein [Symbiobacteriaceae bacterium]